jgi:RNA polymerase sigma factor (sigma-70 family)
LAAFQRLGALYWKPVYALIRHEWNKGNEEAKDLTQEFFTTVLVERGLVGKYAPERGSFRAYLKAALRNFMRDDARAAGCAKRGGGFVGLAVDDADLAGLLPPAKGQTPEALFDAAWKSEVFAQAVGAVERRLKEEGEQACFEAFRRYDLEPGAEEPTYAQVGEAMGLGVDTVKNLLTRARRAFREAVLEIVAETVDNDADYDREIDDLFRT